MSTSLTSFLPLLPYLLFTVRRLMSYLHIFQQEEYDGWRFLRWVSRTYSFDKKLSAIIVLLSAVEAVLKPVGPELGLILSAAFVAFFFIELDPRKSGKKKLVLTVRAKRILAVAAGLAFAAGVVVSLLSLGLWVWLLPVQLLPLALVAANLLLAPVEQRIQKAFWQQAHDKLLSMRPTVVGITGSFGKTSVKHILGHILEMHAPTLLTPGSVNTPMGIARIVREQLGSQHQFFVCEMGAYGPGSIERLCRLASPNVAVVTAVGYAHYERFKSLDVVAKTKLELAQAVIKTGGKIVIAEEVLEFDAARNFYALHPSYVTTVGTSAKADLRVLAIRQTAVAVETDLEWQGKPHTIKSPLYGKHHGMNMALAFATAAVMGIPIETIVLSLRSTPQIKHRLEVKREPNGSIIIDDAYNSNPIGFASALAALDALSSAKGRRILVTPGMVELGEAHEQEHQKIGAVAGSHVDVLLPVVPKRIEAMISAYRMANPAGIVVPCDNFGQARAWLSANLQAGDIVLLENDLPDLYEKKLAL
jgi:UDP-N-acetylmuramoyl-tripeptide--D-alanyl-D-alanine ligase